MGRFALFLKSKWGILTIIMAVAVVAFILYRSKNKANALSAAAADNTTGDSVDQTTQSDNLTSTLTAENGVIVASQGSAESGVLSVGTVIGTNPQATQTPPSPSVPGKSGQTPSGGPTTTRPMTHHIPFIHVTQQGQIANKKVVF